MAVRTTLNYLIAKVRANLGDNLGATETFADEEIQEALDHRREDVYELPLLVAPDNRNFYSDRGGWWEDTVVLTTSDDDVITDVSTPAVVVSNLVTGHWRVNGDLTALYLTGSQFDTNAATADLLDAWLSKVKLEYDFLELGSTFKASQQSFAVEMAIRKFRARQWVQSAYTVNRDYAVGWYS
jgi:hypothetical protein